MKAKSTVHAGVILALSGLSVAAQTTQPVPALKPSIAPVPAAPAVPAPAPGAAPITASSAPAQVPPAVAQPAPPQWSADDIKAAQHACVAILKNLDLVAVGAAPVKEGECGAAAPIELISVGKAPQVTFSPPVTVTCEMAAALHKWVTTDLQGLAKKHLGAPLIRIETMSSYSCRTAYGRRHARLSEHGKANAIDIRAFLTAKAEPADVLAHWGPTERDIAAQVAAAKAAAEKQKAIAAQPAPAVPPGATPNGAAPSAVAATQPTNNGGVQPNIVIGIPGASQPFPSTAPSAIGLSNGLPPPSRLGGPKPPVQAQPPHAQVQTQAQSKSEAPLRGTAAIDLIDGRMKFLKGAHTTACRIFGTVLGPEANNAHRNHFHVDMAHRSGSSFCE